MMLIPKNWFIVSLDDPRPAVMSCAFGLLNYVVAD